MDIFVAFSPVLATIIYLVFEFYKDCRKPIILTYEQNEILAKLIELEKYYEGSAQYDDDRELHRELQRNLNKYKNLLPKELREGYLRSDYKIIIEKG